VKYLSSLQFHDVVVGEILAEVATLGELLVQTQLVRPRIVAGRPNHFLLLQELHEVAPVESFEVLSSAHSYVLLQLEVLLETLQEQLGEAAEVLSQERLVDGHLLFARAVQQLLAEVPVRPRVRVQP